MDKLPYFQWYPKDADTDENVKAMTDQEFGFYFRCLSHAWLNDGIPADLKRLSLVMGRSHEYVEGLWPAVAPCWVAHPLKNERLINRKQEEQRAASIRIGEARRDAANARWAEKRAHKSNARTLHVESQPEPEPYPEPIINTADAVFELCLFQYWVSGGMGRPEMRESVMTAIDMKLPGFLEYEGKVWHEKRAAGQTPSWLGDFLPSLTVWILGRVCGGLDKATIRKALDDPRHERVMVYLQDPPAEWPPFEKFAAVATAA